MLNYINPFIQSRYLYLQAAGSNGDDGSASGIHLRWDFRDFLRDNHLPKGDLATNEYPTGIMFNRPDDYVNIYRAEWDAQYYVSVSFQDPPDRKEESGDSRTWEYEKRGSAGLHHTIQVRFMDIRAYDALKAFYPNLTDEEFFYAYEGIWEIEVLGQVCFYVDLVELSYPAAVAEIEVESISLTDAYKDDTAFISCRHRIRKDADGSVSGSTEVVCEQIKYMRFRHSGAEIHMIQLFPYEDQVRGQYENNNWDLIGKFSLTEDDAEAALRLEDPSQFTIHRRWPKFNDKRPLTGAFTVNVNNYLDRWSPAVNPEDGLKAGVQKYLERSRFDPFALEITSDETGDSNTELSYIELLRMAALDFHVARMLGLGTIDAEFPGSDNFFIYLAEYVTEADLGPDYPARLRQHLFMTLPTNSYFERYPPAPELLPVQYGIYVDNGTQTPSLISDPDGYVPAANGNDDYVRYINIYKDLFDYEKPMEAFFATDRLFCTCEQTLPVMFGLEYKSDDETSYREPELLHDLNYNDPSGLPETIPIPENGETAFPIYTHRETEEGVHEYSLYSINWFSRCSGLSNPVQTDNTRFQVRNSLRPPDNLAVQLIQPEQPRLFTTQAEQNRLAAMPAGDKTLVRVTFDWNHLHNIDYQVADQAEIFFRETAPLVIQGKISAVTQLADYEVEVETGPLPVTSVSPGYDIQPYVDGSHMSRFVGSMMIIAQQPFEVLEVLSSGNNPRFRLKKRRDTFISDPDGDENYRVSEYYYTPPLLQAFIVYENLSDPASWDYRLGKAISIINFTPTHTESTTLPDGQVQTLTVGGMFGPAFVTELPSVYQPDDPAVTADPDQPPFAGDPIPGSRSGVFTIVFRSLNLTDHPDPDVDWYKGIVRISEDASLFPDSGDPAYRPPRMKMLQIASINAKMPLQLTVIDPSFNPNSTFTDPQTEYMPIQTGNGVEVSAHPGYRVYLLADTASGRDFDEGTLLPAPGAGKKVTWLAIRSVDTTKPFVLTSSLRGPAPLLALEINPPVAPRRPSGPTYATRPNVYGKATYTFDTEVDTSGGRTPYSLVFYRASEQKILDTLYAPATVAAIRASLASLPEADAVFFNDRWNDLVNVDFDTSTNTFREYVPGGYRFPLPNNGAYRIPNGDPSIDDRPFASNLDFGDGFTRTLYIKNDGTAVTQTLSFAEVVAEALQAAGLPLAEQPVLYKYIKEGRQTSNRAPLIRDDNSDLIFPGSTIDFNTFDPFPMVVRYDDDDGNSMVRFTDYTLDGAATGFYFYFAVELSNRMEVSDASPVAGPVQLVNTLPAEGPVIKRITSKVANPLMGAPARVQLDIEPFLASEGIRQIEIYRATSAADAATVRRMQLAGTAPVGETLVDDFTDLSVPPYGEALFYRLVALREIRNERDEVERVPSRPSKIALTSIVDTEVPSPPELMYLSDLPLPGPPVTLPNIRLVWEKTVHNGRYHVYKMQRGGAWAKIHTLVSNSDQLELDLAATTLGSAELVKENSAGATVYHHLKVVAENASGLLSREEKRLTI